MERLTEKDQYSQDYKIQAKNLNSHCVAKDAKGYITYYGQHIDKLAEYENLEEQGRLVKLPCKVGDVVYAYCDEFGILEYEVDSIVIDKHITYQCSAYSEPIGDCPSECLDEIEPGISDFDKTVFLTKSEAEAKLKELRGGENESSN